MRTHLMATSCRVLAAAAAAFGLAGCQNNLTRIPLGPMGSRFTARGQEVRPAAGIRRLHLEAGAGELSVTRGEAQEMEIRSEHSVRGPYPEEKLKGWAEQAAARPVVSEGTLTLKAGVPADLPANAVLETRYTLVVPEQTEVTARTRAAGVNIGDLSGGVEVETESGPVVLSDLRGPVRATAASGSIDVANLRAPEGATVLRSASGGISFAGQAGRLEVESTSGFVDVNLESIPRSARIRTRSGQITVTLPQPADVDVEIQAGTGGLELSDLAHPDVEPAGSPGGRLRSAWKGRLGAGGKTLRVRSESGRVRVGGA